MIFCVTSFDKLKAKSFADWDEEPDEPSIFMGFPITIPLIVFSSTIFFISAKKLE